jgi:hypothetical protein
MRAIGTLNPVYRYENASSLSEFPVLSRLVNQVSRGATGLVHTHCIGLDKLCNYVTILSNFKNFRQNATKHAILLTILSSPEFN